MIATVGAHNSSASGGLEGEPIFPEQSHVPVVVQQGDNDSELGEVRLVAA